MDEVEEGSARRRIESALRARIEAGQYAVGDRLPTILQLSEEFGTSGVQTVRDAYRPLIEQGLVEARQGAGYFLARAFSASSGPSAEFPFPGASQALGNPGVQLVLASELVAERVAEAVAYPADDLDRDLAQVMRNEVAEIRKKRLAWFKGGVQVLPSGWVRAYRGPEPYAPYPRRLEFMFAPGEVAAVYHRTQEGILTGTGRRRSEIQEYEDRISEEWQAMEAG